MLKFSSIDLYNLNISLQDIRLNKKTLKDKLKSVLNFLMHL